MGEQEGWAQGGGGGGTLLPNGLLPNAGPLIEVIDTERWIKAEERTAELIASIQPNQPSEERRNAVADYVQRLIMKCFPCQVFTFGSVPLKTYLPDGDIDLTAFSNDPNLKDTWATEVRDMLEIEEKNKDAEFNVKEVQYIQAEVKIIKCLVENIVVDISFNQLGGLCTLCFLEEVDHLINQNHLFKRSIILIKAWCYYESRILGAHHGLISTYALETLVLYIFHVYNNSFSGPLEVLFRFLEFFSNFDWDNFCVSLWGPVPISSLPDVTAEPPRKDSGELLLNRLFLDACSTVYAVFPGGQENQGQPFLSKSFNVIDPLRITNNLGRSVSKGNFFRIRSALAYGAKRLARLLNCPKETLVYEVNTFFHNTWDRHGNGDRPDAPDVDFHFGLSMPDNIPGTENGKNNFCGENEPPGRETEVEETHLRNFIHQHSNSQSESMSKSVNITAAPRAQRQKNIGNLKNSRVISNQLSEKEQRIKTDQLVNDIHRRFLFARTRSSPELTDSYGDVSSQGRRNRTSESGKSQAISAEFNSGSNSHYRNRRKNLEPEQPSRIVRTSDDASSARHTPMHQSLDTADSNNGSSHYHPESGSGTVSEELSSSVGTLAMHQEEQDLVNMMASLQGFNGQIHMPMNFAPGQLPFPIPPSFLASMGFAQRNMSGMLPTNFPLINPAFSNMQFPHGLVSPQLAQYFSGIGMAANSQDPVNPGNENIGSAEMNSGEADNDFWQEPDVNSPSGIDSENGNFEMIQSDDKSKSSSISFNYVPPPRRVSGVGGLVRSQQKNTKEKRGPMREDHLDQYQDNKGNEAYSDERASSSRFSSPAHSHSLRSKTSSEGSWDEPSTVPKAIKEKRGKKLLPAEQSTGYVKGKSTSEQISMPLAEDSDQDWNPLPHVATEMVERSSGPQSLASMHVARPHIPGYESAQTSGSDSMMHMPPMLLEPGSRQRHDSSGGMPLTFYPTGPPVPFLTMLPFNYVQSESGTSDASMSRFGAEESSENGDVSQNFHSSEGLDPSEAFSTNYSLRGAAPGETSEEHKSDILHSDFATHYQNLQFGRFCQSPMTHAPTEYPSPVMVPPMYLQGRVPWDGPGRPLSANMNFFTQLMNYGPRFVPVAPLQSVSNRPPNVYQRYAEDLPRYRAGTGTYLPNPLMNYGPRFVPVAPLQSVSNRPPNLYQRYADNLPRYRTGTGTYLPNPKVSARDRHSSGPRRGNYSYDRFDNHCDREGNWSVNQRSRPASRNHNRNQTDKLSSRMERLAAGESRAERPVSSPRHETFPVYPSQNGPLRPSSSQSGPSNVVYGMYPLPVGNPSGLSSNGQNGPSVMLHPYEQNGGYVSHNEHLEFGSLGPVGFSGTNDQSTLGEGSRSRGSLEEHRYYGGSMQRSSPDQPSSPHQQQQQQHHQRRT